MSPFAKFLAFGSLALSSAECVGGDGTCVNTQDETNLMQVKKHVNFGNERSDPAQPEAAETVDEWVAEDELTQPDELLSGETQTMSGTFRAATAQEAKEFLDQTNMYRCMHGANSLQWSDDVANDANSYVSPLTQMVHSDSYHIAPPAGPAGENLAYRKQSCPQTRTGSGPWTDKPGWTPKKYPPAEAVTAWYVEYDNCARKTSGTWDGCAAHAKPDPAALAAYMASATRENKEKCCPDAGSLGQHNGEYVCQVGHFTSMIWDGVQTMGCAYSKSVNPVVVICRYKAGDISDQNTPNFNMQENQKSHVKKLVKTEAQCRGASATPAVRKVGASQPVQAARAAGRAPVKSAAAGRAPVKVQPPARSQTIDAPVKVAAPKKASPVGGAAGVQEASGTTFSQQLRGVLEGSPQKFNDKWTAAISAAFAKATGPGANPTVTVTVTAKKTTGPESQMEIKIVTVKKTQKAGGGTSTSTSTSSLSGSWSR